MNKIYPIQTIANWFINKEPMTKRKAEKLCYYAQAWSWALYDRPLMDENFQAGVHGPASLILESELKGSFWEKVQPVPGYDADINPEDIKLLEDVWITYGDQSDNALEALTQTELPWMIARGGLDRYTKSENIILPEEMKKYYRSIYLGDEA